MRKRTRVELSPPDFKIGRSDFEGREGHDSQSLPTLATLLINYT